MIDQKIVVLDIGCLFEHAPEICNFWFSQIQAVLVFIILVMIIKKKKKNSPLPKDHPFACSGEAQAPLVGWA